MEKIAVQMRQGVLYPFSQEDREKLSAYKDNQILNLKVSGCRKPRSHEQLKMLFGVLKTVVANTDNANWNSLEKAKLSLKVALGFVDSGVMVVDAQNNVIVKYRSFSYEGLKHMEACQIFDRSWPILAGVIGVSVDELLENSGEGW